MHASGEREHEAPRRLLAVLASTRRRLLARRALERAARVLPPAVLASALLVLTHRVLGDRSPFALSGASLLLAALGVALVPALAAGVAALVVRRPSDLDAALLLDRAHDLSERATAAVALREAPDAKAWAVRALDALDRRGPSALRETIPLRPVPWRRSVVASALAVLAFFAPAWPDAAAPKAAPPDPTLVAVADELAKEAAKTEQELEEKGADPETLHVLDDLQRVAQRAAFEPVSREETIRDLERIEQKARQEQERRQAADAGALSRALSSLEQATLQREQSREASAEEARDLETQLGKLAEKFEQGSKFEERDTKRMTARLRDAAEALAETHPELSAKLSELADALERGDTETAAKLARELAASKELREIAQMVASAEALTDARRAALEALASLGQAASDAELAELAASLEGDGEGEGKGKGEGKGESDRSGKFDRLGRPRVGVDWGVGTTHEAMPEFAITRAGQQADRQSSETSDWREAYDALHDSTSLDDARGRSTRVGGKLGRGEMVSVEGKQLATGAETARLPAVRVPASYARANEEAMAREEVPAAYEAAVTKYFTSLDGSSTDEAPPSAATEKAPLPAATKAPPPAATEKP